MKDETNAELARLSTHGLHQFGRLTSESNVMVGVWTISLLMAATLLGLQLNRVVGLYLSYPTQVDLTIVTADSMNFPAVTFCSLGVVNKKIVRKVPVFKEMEKVMSQFSNSAEKSRKKREVEKQPATVLNQTKEFIAEETITATEYDNTSKEATIDASRPTDSYSPFRSWADTHNINPPPIQSNHINECEMKTTETNASEVSAFVPRSFDDIANDTTLNNSMGLDVAVAPEIQASLLEFKEPNADDSLSKRTKRFGTSPNSCNYWCQTLLSPSYTSTSLATCLASCIPPACLSASYCSYCPSVGFYSCRLYSYNCCNDPNKQNPVTTSFDDVSYYYAVCVSQFDLTTGIINDPGPYIESVPYTFTCNDGTKLNPSLASSAVYTCTSTATWDIPFTACTAFCSDVFSGDVNGVVSTYPTYWTGSTTSFTCNANYQTAAQVSVTWYTCNTNTWSPAFQPCQALCPNIFVTATGTPNVSPPYWSPMSVTFNCATNYFTQLGQPISSKLYTCAGTTWSPTTFSPCLPHCTTMFPTTTGSMSGPWPYPDGSNILFTCKTNYLTVDKLGADNYTCITTAWNKAFSACITTCPNIFDSTGVTTVPHPYMGTPTTYVFACIFQYFTPAKTGSSSYICQSNGMWNIPFQACIKACVQITRGQSSMQIADSEPLVGTFMPSGSNSKFSCIDGYSIRLPKNTVNTNCYNGTWDLLPPGYPYCLQNCPLLDTKQFYARLLVAYDSINTTSVVSGTIGSFSCNNSYYMNGDCNFTSCVNGSWDVAYEDFPICLEGQIPFYSASFLESQQDDNGRKDNLAAGSSLTNMIAYLWGNMSDSMKNSLGFGLADSAIACTFDGRPCDTGKEVRGIQDPSLGNCYTFNHEFMVETLKTSQPGEQHGLHWVFDTKQDDFLSVLATAGIKLIIHQQQEPLFVDAMGIVVSPGYHYNIRIRKESEIRAATPTSQCIESPSQVQYYYYTNRTYTTEGCVRSYFQFLIMGHCHCSSPLYPNANTILRFCTLEDMICVDRFLTNVTKIQTSAALQMCPEPCIGVIERRVVTTTVNIDYDPAMAERNLTEAYIRQNVVGIKVFYDSLDYRVYSESQTYLFLNLATDIGASLGLLLGMSAVSIVEMIIIPIKLRFIN